MSAGEVLREEQFFPVNNRYQHHPRPQFKGRFHRIGDAVLTAALTDNQPVNHSLDGVFFVLVQMKFAGEVMDTPVNTDPDITRFTQVIKHRLIFTFPVLDERRQNHDAAFFGQFLHGVDNLLYRLHGNLPPAAGAVGMSYPGKEQPQVVINLGDGAHRRPRIPARTLLIDRNGRAQPFDIVDVRFFHAAEELAGVGGERFHVAALAFGIDGIKGKRAFPGAGNPGDNNQLVPGDSDVYVFQVVLTSPFDHD